MDIKTEIPKESSGRLLDALTDAIRPFTERQGLKADQIRLQREDVLIEIAERAKRRAIVESIALKPPSTKFLVPFLEKASLEDLASELVEWWVKLLVSAASDEAHQKPIYIDIMSKIGTAEARFLEKLWCAGSKHGRVIPNSLHHELEMRLRRSILQDCNFDDVEGYLQQLPLTLKMEISQWQADGIAAKFFTYPVGSGRGFVSGVIGDEMEIDVCSAVGLVIRSTLDFSIPSPWIGDFYASSEIVVFSELGAAFMRACHAPMKG